MNKLLVLIFSLTALITSCNKAPEKEFNTDEEIIAGNPIDILNSLDKGSVELIVSMQSNNFDNIEQLSDFFFY